MSHPRSVRDDSTVARSPMQTGDATARKKQKSKRIRPTTGAYFAESWDGAGRSFAVRHETFVKAVEQVSRSYSRDGSRPVLTGILTSVERGIVRMVTSDSYRLTVKEVAATASADEPIPEVIIPGSAMQEVARLFSGSGEELIEVALSKDKALFRSGKAVIGTQLVKGNFPAYRRLLPETFAFEAKVSRRELMAALGRVIDFVPKRTVPVELTFSTGTLKVAAEIPLEHELGPGERLIESLAAESTFADEFRIAFNPGYLLDGVEIIDTSDVLFWLNEALTPALVVPATPRGEGPELQHLIMPMRHPALG